MTTRTSRPARAATAVMAVTGPVAVLLLGLVALAGPSAAVAGLGARTGHPSWDLGLGWSSGLVTVLLSAAYVLAAGCVAAGLVAVPRGLRIRPGVVAAIAVPVVLLLTLLPATGSADHLSYLAYGRIAAAGDDVYRQDPLAWRGGTDPVAGAVAPPWQHTPSVYGPLATLLQAGVATLGAGDLRLTAWFWQILCGAAFLGCGLVLDRMVGHDPAARTRAALLWTLNPLLLGQLVLGGHLDVIAVALAMAGIAWTVRNPFVAGLFIGAAIGSKITFALFALAALWALRRHEHRVRAAAVGVLGMLAVLLPVHLLIGRNAYTQLQRASEQVSLATIWRPVLETFRADVPDLRLVISRTAMLLAVGLAVLLARRFRLASGHPTGSVAATVLAAGWLLTAPYVLPWYDAMVWAPLAVIAAGALDAALLARLLVMSLAYVPGLVTGMSPGVERFTLALRADVAPWLNLAVLLLVAGWAAGPVRRRRPRSASPPVGARAR